jgi:hypothetical protein
MQGFLLTYPSARARIIALDEFTKTKGTKARNEHRSRQIPASGRRGF